MTIYVNVDDQWQHRSLVREIVRRAHAAGLAGATVLHGVEGYGIGSFIHTARLLDVSDGLPAVVVLVDRDDKIREFLPRLDEIITDGLVTLDPVDAVRFGTGTTSP